MITPKPPEGFQWELIQPPIDVGGNLPGYRRLVGPWVPVDYDEWVSIDSYHFELKINLTPEELKRYSR